MSRSSPTPAPPPSDDDLELPGYGPAVLLTQGGYSHIYRVHQPQFDRSVAVKVLAFALTDYKAQRRFQRECRLAGRLSAHPNIVTVHDAGIAPDGRPYITMEYFPAGSIADRIHRDGPFKVSDALRIGIACAGALETAHRAGVIHRDVKPANVLLTSYGQPALADFGLSVLAERQAVTAGADALTPYHAPPEMLERSAATARSDVYSLASTVYTMLAGRAPHQGQGGSGSSSTPSVGELLLSILQQDVPAIDRPGIPQSLEDVLAGGLARDPAERTPTALDFAQGLQEVQLQLGYEVTDPIVIDVDTGASPAGGAGGGDGSSPSTASRSPEAFWSTTSPDLDEQRPPRGIGPDETGEPEIEIAFPPSLDTGPDRDRDRAFDGDLALDRDRAFDRGRVDEGDGFFDDLGDTTIERSAAFAPLPRPLTRPDHRRSARPRSWRAPAVAGVAIVAGLALVLALRSVGSDPPEREDPEGSAAPADPPDDPGAGLGADGGASTEADGAAAPDGEQIADVDGIEPSSLTAIESAAGVTLDWSGDPDARHVVLVMSESASPRLRPAVQGLQDLVPASELEPDSGYCFAVAREDTILAMPGDELINEAFSPPACIRGASSNTVEPE